MDQLNQLKSQLGSLVTTEETKPTRVRRRYSATLREHRRRQRTPYALMKRPLLDEASVDVLYSVAGFSLSAVSVRLGQRCHMHDASSAPSILDASRQPCCREGNSIAALRLRPLASGLALASRCCYCLLGQRQRQEVRDVCSDA